MQYNCSAFYYCYCRDSLFNAYIKQFQSGELPKQIFHPSGYVRVATEKGEFGSFLRELPLKSKDTKIQLYKGGDANFQFLGYAVVDIPLFSNDEQCADVCMRLWAEYLYSKGQYNKISFTDVNGKKMNYQEGNSRSAFKKYMRRVFGMCNTNSLHKYLKKKVLLIW